jgi:RNA polymerase-binding protein DksA
MAQRTSSAGKTRSRSAPARSGASVSAAAKKPAKKTVKKLVKKPAAKKAAPKKVAPKKAAPKKVPAKKAAPKKAAPKKAKKAAPKKVAPKKVPAKKAAPKKAPAKKVTAKKVPAKKAAPKKAPAAQAQAAKSPEPSKASVAPPVKRPATPLKTAATSAPRPTRRGRKPLTPAERQEMKGVLRSEKARLEHEIASAVEDLNELLRDSGDGSGDDQADAGSKTFEREHEMSVANNSRDLLVQVEHALQRIKDGTYGTCESCGLPIGKMRLEAFPRATLCVDCKQRQERR